MSVARAIGRPDLSGEAMTADADAGSPSAMTPLRRALLTAAAMAATLMQVLDTSIANIALPHMQRR